MMVNSGRFNSCELVGKCDVDEMLGLAGRGHDAVSDFEGLFCEGSAKAAGRSGH
jgi:hypothetical protein